MSLTAFSTRRAIVARLLKPFLSKARSLRVTPRPEDEMPPKATGASIDEASFVKICLAHYKNPMNKGDFDFDAIANKAGVKNAQAAYQRFWAIKKKWAMGENAGDAATTLATKGNGVKRGSNGTVKVMESGSPVPGDDDDESDTGSMAANVGSDAEKGDDEHESKKMKTE